MYNDLKSYINDVENDKNTGNVESNSIMLNIYYNKLNKHINELYVLVRENYSFIVKMENTQGVDERRFIEIMGNILTEAGNAKDVIENIIKPQY